MVRRDNARLRRFLLLPLVLVSLFPVPPAGAAPAEERTARAVAQAPAALAPGDLLLISTSDAGVKGDGPSENPAIPSDASRVAFRSEATNLDPLDPDAISDEYVKDVLTGDLTLVSTNDSGVKANGYSANPVFSADGTTLAFRSGASNLVPEDPDTTFDIYVKDLGTGEIALASTSDEGVKGDNASYNPYLSRDGTKVAFRSGATNLDPLDRDRKQDVYVKDMATGDLVLASTTSGNDTKGNGASGNPALSADGTRIAFYSESTNLVPEDTEPGPDIFVKDLATGAIVLASTSATGVNGNGKSILPHLSSDGTKVAFVSSATNLHPDDRDSVSDVYVKDLVTGEISLASTTEGGRKGNSHSESPYLSADGARVAFRSGSTNLDPGDTDDLRDLYVKDLSTGDLVLVSTSSSGVKGNAVSENPALSADGSSVSFYSFATNLHPDDSDTHPDVYLKQIDGSADVSVSASDAPDPVQLGGTLTYDIDVTNHGGASATGIDLRQALSSRVVFLSASASQGDGCAFAAGTVTCDLGGLGPRASAAVTVEVQPARVGTLISTVTVVANEPDPATENNQTETTTTVSGAADLSVTTTDSPDPVAKGETLTHVVTVMNAGPSSATKVTLAVEFSGPVGSMVVTPSQGTCTTPKATFSCTLGVLMPGATATVTVQLSPKQVGILTNTSTATAVQHDPAPANNTFSEETRVTSE